MGATKPRLERREARPTLWLIVALVAGWLPALLDPGALEAAATLHDAANEPNPYLRLDHGLALYLRAPVAILSATALLLSPGLFWQLGNADRIDAGRWILRAFAFSLVSLSIGSATVQLATGTTLVGRPFSLFVVVCSFTALTIAWRRRRTDGLVPPRLDRSPWGFTVTLIGPLYILLVALAPKLYWEAFTPDGVHAFEAARLLERQVFPFFGPDSGGFLNWPGMTTVLYLYPTSWFVRLFGHLEAAARAPLALFVLLLYLALVAVIRWRRESTMRTLDHVLLWLAVFVYLLVAVFNFTYSPYFADITLPATQDTLLVALFLAFVAAYQKQAVGWMLLFLGATYFTSPSGLLLVGLFIAAGAALLGREHWRRLAAPAGGLVLCVLLGALAPLLMSALGEPTPGGEHGFANLLERFQQLQVGQWQRLLFLILPASILPALMLGAWPLQDRWGRVLSAVTGCYFALFYLQAYVSIHHFAPVMLLPLVVFWRARPAVDTRLRRWALPALAIAAVLAAVLSWPQNSAPHTTIRTIGEAIAERTGHDQETDSAKYGRLDVLREILVRPLHPDVPESRYGGSTQQLHYYARRDADLDSVNYVLQPIGGSAPAGFELLGSVDGLDLFVRDRALLRRHQSMQAEHPPGSRLYVRPRSMLFRGRQAPDAAHIYDVCAILKVRLGLELCEPQ